MSDSNHIEESKTEALDEKVFDLKLSESYHIFSNIKGVPVPWEGLLLLLLLLLLCIFCFYYKLLTK